MTTLLEAPVEKEIHGKVLPTLKIPDPVFVFDRLEAGKSSGILAMRPHEDRIGLEHLVLDEVARDGAPQAFGVLKVTGAVLFEDMRAIQDSVLQGIDEETLKEFSEERDFYYFPLTLGRRLPTPETLVRSPSGRRFGAEASIAELQKEEVFKVSLEDLVNAHVFVLAEMERRGMKHIDEDRLDQVTRDFLKKRTHLGRKKKKKKTSLYKRRTDGEQLAMEMESIEIADNKTEPEAKSPHQFQVTKFAYPDGELRCLQCGEEETISGWCNVATAVEVRVAKLHHQIVRALEEGGDEQWNVDPAVSCDGSGTPGGSAFYGGSGRTYGTVQAAEELRKRALEEARECVFAQEGIEKGLPNQTPEAGVHAHNLAREESRTQLDGIHPHLFFLPDGRSLWTEEDGPHRHALQNPKSDQTDFDGPHRHKVILPFDVELDGMTLPAGTTLFTEEGGEHTHMNLVWNTGLDGVHKHRWVLPDGTVLENFLPGDYWEHFGAPGQGNLPAAPAASDLVRLHPDILEKRELAPTNASGETMGEEITLAQVLEHVKRTKLRSPAVFLVGGLANHGKTVNDIDILIKGPMDPATRHVVMVKIGRMFPPDLSHRIQFLEDDLGGPITNNVPLFDLEMVVPAEFVVKEMRDPAGAEQAAIAWLGKRFGPAEADRAREYFELVEKQGDPFLKFPSARGKQRAVLQGHHRGKTYHWDLRMDVGENLIGWTISIQKPGKVPDVNSLEEARKIAAGYDMEKGNRFLKPILAPAKLQGFTKAPQPERWLKKAQEWVKQADGSLRLLTVQKFEGVVEPGDVGATTEEEGVFLIVDGSIEAEWGRQEGEFHEYFLTGNTLEGILFARQLDAEREAGQPEKIWNLWISREFLPSILTTGAVRSKAMPPDGHSALPLSLEKQIPSDFQYWKAKGAEAREIRDDLVKSRFLTKDNVKLASGEFRRVEQVTKTYLWKGDPDAWVEKRTVPFVLHRQIWGGPVSVRAGVPRELWRVIFDKGDEGVEWFELDGDPRAADQVEAIRFVSEDRSILTATGEQDPGTKLNPTKDVASTIEIIDEGGAFVLEDEEERKQLRFEGEKLTGTYTLEAGEDETSTVWTLARGEEVEKIHGRYTDAVPCSPHQVMEKVNRKASLLVLEQFPVEGEEKRWTYDLAVGPVTEEDAKGWRDSVEFDGQHWVKVGRSATSDLEADPGAILSVEFLGLKFDTRQEDAKILTLFGSPRILTGLTDAKIPDSVSELVELAQPEELQKREHFVQLHKLDDDGERFVLGAVLVPETVDAQKDIYSHEEVEKACHYHSEHGGFQINFMHREPVPDGAVKVLESGIARGAFEIASRKIIAGTWFMAMRVLDDEIWKDIKLGKLTGFSIGGLAEILAEIRKFRVAA